MDNLEYIIFGGGERAFDIIHKLPYGSIKYIVDNDIDKCGKNIHGISIFNPRVLLNEKNNVIVILTFKDKDVEEKLKKLGMIYFFSFGQESNIFNTYEMKIYMDNMHMYSLLYDHRLLKFAKKVSLVDHWRIIYYNENNKKIVHMLKNNDDAQKKYLELYSYNDFFYDEYYDVRPGIRLACDFIKNMKLKKILDIACGHGELIKNLFSKEVNVYGLDNNKQRVECLNKLGMHVKEGDVEALPYEDETFDVVTCMECLEHICNPNKAVIEMYRVLNRGGYIIITVPYKYSCYCEEHVRIFNEDYLYSYFCEYFTILNIIKIPYLNWENENNLFLLGKK